MAPSWSSPRDESRGRLSSPQGVMAAWARRSYASDYVAFFVLLACYLVAVFFFEPFHRMFAISDLRIAFPYAEVERVPLSLDFVYALFIPLFVLIAYNLATRASIHKHQVTILGLAISLILASLLTEIVKNLAGRPRPDLLARCKPAAGTPRDVLVTIAACTETRHHVLHDGWRSFPSGHSSFSFAGLGHTSLLLAGQLRIFACRAGGSGAKAAEKLVRSDLGRSLACLAPLLVATWVAISRCQDYRHDVYDVTVGALLGASVAYWSYRRYWPRLSSPRCHVPYPGPLPPDEDGDDDDGDASQYRQTRYGRVRDEEEGGAADQNVGIELAAMERGMR